VKRNYKEDSEYKLFRQTVRKRDGYKCQMPGCNSRRLLQVHHIKPWSRGAALRYDPNNGITLCKHCHKLITGHEHIYAPMFEEIING
jgi:5-methylcytosine-specific restriction endonuclease McrA